MLRALRPGDGIALVAPASPFDIEAFNRGRELLQERGYRVLPGEHVLDRNGYLAGSEADRASDLVRAFQDPRAAAVFCVRGGYGSGKLLPWLSFSAMSAQPKIFLGHSDITFLHLAFFHKLRWVTFHGPNLTGIAKGPRQADHVLSCLGEDRPETHPFSWNLAQADILRHGTASGVVLGGNLTCLAHLLSTPFFPDLTNCLLMVEDRGEAVYRLDRIFSQLRLAGIFQRISGLILGGFTECGDMEAIHRMVMETVSPYSFPVVANLPFGHGEENEVIPLGLPFSLNTRNGWLKAVQNPFRGSSPP